MDMDKGLVYEYIISEEEIKELKNVGLTANGIIAFADDIMDRYFNAEYLDQRDIDVYNEEG